jgi:hypothetical protein
VCFLQRTGWYRGKDIMVLYLFPLFSNPQKIETMNWHIIVIYLSYGIQCLEGGGRREQSSLGWQDGAAEVIKCLQCAGAV